MLRWLYRLYIAALIAGVIATAVLALVRPATVAVHTAGFAMQVLPVPIKPQPWLSLPPTHFVDVHQSADGIPTRSDVYVIDDGQPRAGLLVVLGANATGADDPDIINLGMALARTGFAATFYWSSQLGDDANIATSEIESLILAFERMSRQPYVDASRMGMAGFSVGASLSLVAATDPRIASRVAFVNAFGGYYDAGDLLIQIASGSAMNDQDAGDWRVDRLTEEIFSKAFGGYFDAGDLLLEIASGSAADDDAASEWPVDRLTRQVFVNEITDSIPDPARRAEIRAAAHAGAELPAPDGSPLEATVMALLGGELTIAEARQWYAHLPETYRRQIAAVSPSAHLANIHPNTHVLLMHDRGDRLIPVGESRRFAEALRQQENVRYKYTETDIFDHVRPDSDRDLPTIAGGAVQIFRHVYGIINVAG